MATSEILEQLKDKSSGKRKSAAKQLRKQIIPNAGEYLLDALKIEVLDKRTWETQYNMVMAIAHNEYVEALPFLSTIVDSDIEPMTMIGVGDAITRLEWIKFGKLKTLPSAIQNRNLTLCEGGIRALAIAQIKNVEETFVEELIEFTMKPENHRLLFWTCAASAGWKKDKVSSFLKFCAESNITSDETKKAAVAALKGKYLKWSIL